MSSKSAGLNIHLMDAHDLVRWVQPMTELEKVLFEKLKEFTDETGRYAEVIAEIETARQELQVAEEELEKANAQIAEQENALAEANQRIDELTEELANTLT